MDKNRRVVLASRPEGAPSEDNFSIEELGVPEPARGEVLLRTVFLSLDPYMRGRMSDAKSYAEPVPLGGVMVGGTVSRVLVSHLDDFEEGDWVLGYCGWQDYAISDGEGLVNLGKNPSHPSYALGVLGMPGITAYYGLLEIGQPKAGDTLVVAAATGPVGSTVGQIGKIQGCRVVGIAGGAEKCRYAVEELGFDICLNHRAEEFPEQLEEACPDGVDVYFENVGGDVFDAVLPLLNDFARVPVCGLVAHYNATSLPEGPDRLSLLMREILTKRLKIQGFIIFDQYERFGDFIIGLSHWVGEGRIKYREDLVEGLEKAPRALMGLLQGENFGKVVVRLGTDD
ncbi:NADP-dependent oxidoreductase [Microbulbifer variabilis]|jgi:NADPH-dependent curcumin reductase CurA|uniref:NADP-dependent oxidoreductase n=1 Tax=Microbulbifer variabilis TaxID=266805 RepID=A0ABY4VHY5_9GAMM|nr:NADP-dependent oxidoreductase [Microbulbifer variabilis]USD23645.1 NADP-dependent oxidoreductase [Microbulbifer variabilis]